MTATGTIRDDDDDAVGVSIENASAPEGELLVFPVRLNGPAEQEIDLSYTTRALSSASAATPGDDYLASSGSLTIREGDVGGVVRVRTLADDDYGESTELLLVELASVSDEVYLNPRSAVGTIENVVPSTVGVANATAEEGQSLVFEITLDRAADEPVTVAYATGGGTATAGLDYLRAASIVRFAPGEVRKTVEVAALADSDDREGDENFFLTLSNPQNALLGDTRGEGRIINLPPPEITVGDLRVAEGAAAVFQIALSNRTDRDITMNYATASRAAAGAIAATSGADYTPVSGAVTIPSGAATAAVAVPTADDSLDEYAETFRFVLSDPSYGRLADPSAVGTIVDDDPLPELSAADAFADEGAGALPVAITLDQPSGRNITVDYRLASGTATAGDDYTDASGTLTIPAGQTRSTLRVALIDDDDSEGPETLTVMLSNPQNAFVSDRDALLTIVDDEGLPTIVAVSHGGVAEGSPAQIALRLSRASQSAVTVVYATADGTATAPADYTAVAATTVTFAAGDTDKTLSTPTADDDEAEDTETFVWSLSSAQGAVLAADSASSQIIDNDTLPEMSVGDAHAVEGSGPLRFTVRLTSPASDAVTVAYRAVADPFAGSAAAVPGLDFTPVAGSLSIPAGALTAVVEVPVADDSLDEGAETLWLRLETATGAGISDAVATGVIADDDPEPSLAIGAAAAVEGSPLRFPVRLSGPSGRVVRVQYAPQPSATAANPAAPVDDYNPASRSLAFPPGTTLAHAAVATVADRLDEHSETLLARLFNPTHATVADATATGTIIDANDVPRAAIADTEVLENRGPARFTVTLTHPSTQPITIAYNTAPDTADTATATADYTAASGTLAFPPGAVRRSFTVPVADDSVAEPDETFTVEIRNPVNADIIDGAATATILDDDGLPRFSISPTAANENGSALTFKVTLSHPSAQPATVDYATFDNTASQPGDYTATTGTLAFPAASVRQTITVPVSDDLLDEFDETITVRLSNPTAATVRGAQAAATGTIRDDDPEPRLRLLDTAAAEGDPLLFTAILAAPSGRTVTADYTTAADAGAAFPAADDDYTAAAGTVTFPPGATRQTIAVATAADAHTEAPETLRLILTNPNWAALTSADAAATGTIQNRGLPAITIDDAAALEGDPIVFTVKLDRPANTDITINPSHSPASATPNADYQWGARRPALITIPAGQTQATLSVPTTADTAIEVDEAFLVTLAIAGGNAQLADASAIGTILENPLIPSVSVGDAEAAEGATITFTVTLDRPANTAAAPATISYTTNPLTATPGTDYAPEHGTLAFAASTTTQTLTISVATVPDTLAEAAETLQLQLHSPQGAVIDDRLGTGTILDDDLEPTLSIQPAETDEGTPLTLTATLNTRSGRTITTDYQTTSGTATDGIDYTTAAGTLTFPPGTTTQTITIETLPDNLVEPDETLTVTLTNPQGATLGTASAATIIDATRPAIRIAGATAHEGSPLTFTVTLNRQTTTPTTVTYTTADATATAGADYTAQTSQTLTLPPGTTTQTIAIATLPDDLVEPDETLTVTLANPSAGTRILTATATGTIEDNPRPTITVADAEATEVGPLRFWVRLSRPATEPVTVKYSTAAGTAAGGSGLYHYRHLFYTGADFGSESGTLTFRPGETSQSIEIEISQDGVDEEAEALTLELSDAVNAILDPDPYRATGTIYDVDPTPAINIITDTVSEVLPGGQPNTVTVTMDRWSSRDVTVDWALAENNTASPGAARAGADFVADSGTATISAGTTSTTVDVEIVDDDVYEDVESFTVDLSNPTNAVLLTTSAPNNFSGWRIPIHDNEPYLYDLRPTTATEGDQMVFTINISSHSSDQQRTISYQLVDGTAISGRDYGGATSGTLTFHASQTVGTITVPTTADSDPEGSEYFELRLSTPSNIGIRSQSDAIRATITDNSRRVVSIYGIRTNESLQYSENRIYANTTEGKLAVLHIELNAASAHDVTVDYELVGGTGSSSDYSSQSQRSDSWPTGSVTIPAGQTRTTVKMLIVGDLVFEPEESFQVRITSSDDVNIGQATAEMLAQDSTGPPVINISDAAASEGETVSFTVGFDYKSSVYETTVDYTTVDSTAIAGTHYTSTSGTLTFRPGQTRKTIQVPTTDDDVLAGDKIFTVELSNPVSASIERGSATGRIIEDDCVDLADAGQSPPTLRLASASAEEGENLSFAVSLSKPFCDDVAQAVSLTTALGTATAADAATPAAVLGFKAGATEAAYTGLSTIEDAIDEDDETVTATIAWHSTMPADYRAQPAATATGTIEDDDPQPSLRIIDATAQEGDNLVFIATLDNPSGRTVTVDYTTNTAGTATAADYTPINGPDSQLVFNPGETAKQITVATAQDTLDEDDETIRVVLSDPQNAALDDTTAIGTIEDDDPQPTATIADTASAENRPLRFTITLDNPSGRTVTIAYTTADGTATTADNDYTAATGTATITPGNTTTTIEITTTADNTPEADETLTITLTTATTDNQHQTTNTHISTTNATATGTIQNDD